MVGIMESTGRAAAELYNHLRHLAVEEGEEVAQIANALSEQALMRREALIAVSMVSSAVGMLLSSVCPRNAAIVGGSRISVLRIYSSKPISPAMSAITTIPPIHAVRVAFFSRAVSLRRNVARS